MIIRAARPEAHFVMIRNAVARDENLSFRARGVLVAILSRPDDWSISAENLAREGQESVKMIYRVLKELENAGYVRRRRVRNAQGQLRTETLVYDEPQEPTSQKPSVGEPTSRATDSRQRESVTKTDIQKQNTKTETQTSATAKAIARNWWEAQTEKPLQSFIALVKVIERAVKAGYQNERIERAMATFDFVPTLAQLQTQLKKNTPSVSAREQRTLELFAMARANREKGMNNES